MGSVTVPAVVSAAAAVPAPTLLHVAPERSTTDQRTIIAGVAVNDSTIQVFIDGTLNGTFGVANHPSGTASFLYPSFLPLAAGWHTASTRAFDIGGRATAQSNTLTFLVEHPYPAPVLLPPVTTAEGPIERPFLVGLVRNDSMLTVFVDGVETCEQRPANHASGTANFACQPDTAFAPGTHTVVAIACDAGGKCSRSATRPFVVAPALSTDAAAVTAETTGTITAEAASTEPGAPVSDLTTDGASQEEVTASSAPAEENDDEWPKPSTWYVIAGIVVVLVAARFVRRGDEAIGSNGTPSVRPTPATPPVPPTVSSAAPATTVSSNPPPSTPATTPTNYPPPPPARA